MLSKVDVQEDGKVWLDFFFQKHLAAVSVELLKFMGFTMGW